MVKSDSDEMAAKKNQGGLGRGLRVAAIITLAIGAAGSLGFMFLAGQHTPRLLLFFFVVWVLSPFAVLFWAIAVSKRWSLVTRATLYCVALIITLSSLVIYGEWIDVRPAGSANAFRFVIVPPVSLIFTVTVVVTAAFISRRLSRPHDEIKRP